MEQHIYKRKTPLGSFSGVVVIIRTYNSKYDLEYKK